MAAKFGTGDQSTEIEGHQPEVLEGFRHFAGDDALGKQLGNGGLANPRSTDQDRVVLAATGQDLDQVANFRIATNHRIEIPHLRFSREITAIGLQW